MGCSRGWVGAHVAGCSMVEVVGVMGGGGQGPGWGPAVGLVEECQGGVCTWCGPPGCSPLGICLLGWGQGITPRTPLECLWAIILSFKSYHPISNHNRCPLSSACCMHSLG